MLKTDQTLMIMEIIVHINSKHESKPIPAEENDDVLLNAPGKGSNVINVKRKKSKGHRL